MIASCIESCLADWFQLEIKSNKESRIFSTSSKVSSVTCWQQPVIGCWKLLILLQSERAGTILIQGEDVNGERTALQVKRLRWRERVIEKKKKKNKQVYNINYLNEKKMLPFPRDQPEPQIPHVSAGIPHQTLSICNFHKPRCGDSVEPEHVSSHQTV